MAFEGFTVEGMATRGATIHALRKGAGPLPPVLRRISSGTTLPCARHEDYSFRKMAQDQVEVMRRPSKCDLRRLRGACSSPANPARSRVGIVRALGLTWAASMTTPLKESILIVLTITPNRFLGVYRIHPSSSISLLEIAV
jgi:hypothetical protein